MKNRPVYIKDEGSVTAERRHSSIYRILPNELFSIYKVAVAVATSKPKNIDPIITDDKTDTQNTQTSAKLGKSIISIAQGQGQG